MSDEIKIHLTGELYDVFDVETAEVAKIEPTEPSNGTFEAINKLAKVIHENALNKGFWQRENNVGEKLMLIVSEVGEACEADRNDRYAEIGTIDTNIINLDLPCEFENFVKDTFEDEIADIIIRTLDLAAGMNIDIGRHIKLKMNHNKTREKLHGKRY